MNFLPSTALVDKGNLNGSLEGLLGERGEITPKTLASETDYETASLALCLILLGNHYIFGFPLRITGTSTYPELVKPCYFMWTLLMKGVVTESARPLGLKNCSGPVPV